MRGIKTVDGREHELDTILYATGFDLEASNSSGGADGPVDLTRNSSTSSRLTYDGDSDSSNAHMDY